MAVTVPARSLKAAKPQSEDSHALSPSGDDGRSTGNGVAHDAHAEQDGSAVHSVMPLIVRSQDDVQGVSHTGDSSIAAGDNGGGDSAVAGADEEPTDFKKMGHILQNTPVLTEAAKHLGAMTWKNKENEEEISRNAADIPVANVLPLAYHGKPKPDDLGFMPPTVDQSLGLTDGPLENSDEVRLGSEPIKAAKPLSQA